MENIKIVDIKEYMKLLGYDIGYWGYKRNFDELRELIKDDEKWDYPIEEFDYCVENNIKVILVRYWDCLGWNERLFEV